MYVYFFLSLSLSTCVLHSHYDWLSTTETTPSNSMFRNRSICAMKSVPGRKTMSSVLSAPHTLQLRYSAARTLSDGGCLHFRSCLPLVPHTFFFSVVTRPLTMLSHGRSRQGMNFFQASRTLLPSPNCSSSFAAALVVRMGSLNVVWPFLRWARRSLPCWDGMQVPMQKVQRGHMLRIHKASPRNCS